MTYRAGRRSRQCVRHARASVGAARPRRDTDELDAALDPSAAAARWSRSTASRWSCGAHAGAVGLIAAHCSRLGDADRPAETRRRARRAFRRPTAATRRRGRRRASRLEAPGTEQLHAAQAHDRGPRVGEGLDPAFDHQAGHAVPSQGDRGDQAGGAAADHEHRDVGRSSCSHLQHPPPPISHDSMSFNYTLSLARQMSSEMATACQRRKYEQRLRAETAEATRRRMLDAVAAELRVPDRAGEPRPGRAPGAGRRARRCTSCSARSRAVRRVRRGPLGANRPRRPHARGRACGRA